VLVLAGRHDGAYESLASLASELQIEGYVRFAGPVSDVRGLLNAVDVSVFSSRSEGCPNAVLESMAAGLPIAGSDIKGIRDVVGFGGTQFLAPVGDAESLAEVLLTMAKNPELCARIGTENSERVKQKYDSLRMCRETAALLAKILLVF
jgi:glycosyltransferase involved in cell wall biosynthesis